MASKFARRWSSPDGSRAAEDAFAALGSGRLHELVGESDGRLDLRGFRLPDIETSGRRTVGGQAYTRLATSRRVIEGSTLRRIDFGEASFAHIDFVDCTIEDVIFDDTRLDSVRFFRSRLTNCSFDRTKWTAGAFSSPGAGLEPQSPGDGCAYVHCSFNGTAIRGAVCYGVTLSDCEMRGVRLSGLHFRQPVIQRTVISGALADIQFDGRWSRPAPGGVLHSVDFGDAVFDDVDLRQVDCQDVTWPRRQRYIWLTGDVRGLLDGMVGAGTDDPLVRSYIDVGRQSVAPGRQEFLIVTDDFVNSSDAREHQMELAAESDFLAIAQRVAGTVPGTVEFGVHRPE